MTAPAPGHGFRHGLNQWPPPVTTLLLSLQWLAALLPGLLVLSHNYALVGLLQEMDLAPQPPQMSGT